MNTLIVYKGVAILLFAILLQLCSSGMELLTLGVGILGLILAIIEDKKSSEYTNTAVYKEIKDK